jgi:hypothetical protein
VALSINAKTPKAVIGAFLNSVAQRNRSIQPQENALQ